MAEGVRSALLLRTCLEVLREGGTPLHGREVIKRISERVGLTSSELATIKSGAPRWEVDVGFYSGDAATIGWLVKRDNQWWITEAGLGRVSEVVRGCRL